ncbi:MAG: hypothetical protein Q7T92_10640 [Lutibacter sp.]|nr:hypothetical protein [Lutibacter sp.]
MQNNRDKSQQVQQSRTPKALKMGEQIFNLIRFKDSSTDKNKKTHLVEMGKIAMKKIGFKA